jgi:uncharacterized membrane protein YraQ (UPF0718 family)
VLERLLGAVVAVVAVVLFVDGLNARRGRAFLRAAPVTDGLRRGLMAALCVLATVAILPALVPTLRQGLFAFCGFCPLSPIAGNPISSFGDFTRAFFLATWYYAATVLPVFVLACLLSGLLIARASRIRIRGAAASFVAAALLPLCACGSIPIGKTMIDRGGSGVSDGLVFLVVAPLLSPIILLLGVGMLGPGYVGLRVLGSVAIAIAAVAVVRPFVQSPEPATRTASAASSCREASAGTGRSVLLAGWALLTSLLRYVLYGVVIGALVAVALPEEVLGAILRPGLLSTAAAVVVGVPISMCAGEEILLSAPLVGGGLTLGQALAFALTSTGICLGSLPLLAAVLGRKATLALVGVYLVVPFLLGVVVDALPFEGFASTGAPLTP